MGKGMAFRWPAWLMQVVVAVCYALAYMAVRPFSDAHWALTSGLRMACLLLMPYRLWPALIVGELVPLTYMSLLCLDQFGLGWVVLRSIPPVATAMPIVWYFRQRLAVFPNSDTIDVKRLLACVLASSITWAAISYAAMLIAIPPADPAERPTPMDFVVMLVGNYVAILTVVTWPLLIKLARREHSFRELWNSALEAPLTRDSACFMFPSLMILAMISMHIKGDWKEIFQMTLFAPVFWLTIKYGWRGTAVSGPLAVAAICLITTELDVPDPAVVRVQLGIAAAVTCLFFMGASVAAQYYALDRERRAVRNAMRVAQQAIYQSEFRLRHTSKSLEIITGAASINQGRFMERVRLVLGADEYSSISRQINSSRQQLYSLAESLHPIAWRDRGLIGAMKESIGRTLDEAGIAYQCAFDGYGLSMLSSTLHQTVYRLACEAVAIVTTPQTCNDVRVVLRGGRNSRGERWAVLRVVGEKSGLDIRQIAFNSRNRNGIGAKLHTQGMDEQAIRDLAALFSGLARIRRKSDATIVSVLLHDASYLATGRSAEIPTAKMWVH